MDFCGDMLCFTVFRIGLLFVLLFKGSLTIFVYNGFLMTLLLNWVKRPKLRTLRLFLCLLTTISNTGEQNIFFRA